MLELRLSRVMVNFSLKFCIFNSLYQIRSIRKDQIVPLLFQSKF